MDKYFVKKLGSKLLPIEDNYHKLLTKETELFIDLQTKLYTHLSSITVIGTSFAQELFTHHMMNKLFDGYIKNYKNLFKISEEFTKTQIYFIAHVNGTEENHANLISDLIYCTCQDMDNLEEIDSSYKKFEEITIMFWNGIYSELI